MLTREHILGLIPHQGTMCLLDRVLDWSAGEIVCAASSHLAPDNPLRRDGRLGAICGIEYGLQAAALHGALVRGGVTSATLAVAAAEEPVALVACAGIGQAAAASRIAVAGHAAAAGTVGTDMRKPAPAYLAALRSVELFVEYLDDPALGLLRVTAAPELVAPSGSIYWFAVASESARPLLRGRATIAFPGPRA